MRRNSVRISFEQFDMPAPCGASKLGGKPDLPEGFEWKIFRADGNTLSLPLTFLMQINCAEFSHYDLDGELPSSGMLYFFYDLESMPSGERLRDMGGAQVYYYDGDIDKLRPTARPCSPSIPLRYGRELPEMKLVFEAYPEYPSFDEFGLIAGDSPEKFFPFTPEDELDLWEFYTDTIEELYENDEQAWELLPKYSGDTDEGEDICGHKALGYAEIIYVPPVECSTRMISQAHDRTVILQPDAAMRRQCRMLIQLDSFAFEDWALRFGDCGTLYYYIDEDALRNRDFSRAWAIMHTF